MPTWSLVYTPAYLPVYLLRIHNALLPVTYLILSFIQKLNLRLLRSFGKMLKSRLSSVHYHSTSELLRTL